VSRDAVPVKLVCFDLGGVLIRICRSWDEGCAAAGLEVRGDWSRAEPLAATWPTLRQQLQTGAIDRATYASRLSAAMGGLYTAPEIERIHHAWLLGEYTGVCEVIDRIHAAGVQTAALSNTDHAHWEQMRDLPALQRLGHRHASHLLRLQKPDAAIYRAFESAVGVPGAHILFFDDLIENVEAARRAGWRAVQVNHDGDPAQQMAAALCECAVFSRPHAPDRPS